MKIAKKLALQNELGGLVLFKEGLFLKAYNESCYILTQLFNHDLKVRCYRVKYLNNQWVTESGFPHTKLAEWLPQSVLTDFGAQFSGDFDLSSYQTWYERRCRAENEVQSRAKADARLLQTKSASAPSQGGEFLTNSILPLTEQQYAFLQTWQKGHYPIEVDLAFIESLKNQMIN